MNWLKHSALLESKEKKKWDLEVTKVGSADPGRNLLASRDALQTFSQATLTSREAQAALTTLQYPFSSAFPCSPGLEADRAVEAPGADSTPWTDQMQSLLLQHEDSVWAETSITRRKCYPYP